MKRWTACVAAAALWAAAGNAAAERNLQVGAEDFRWREYDANGGRLLQERGPRLRVGGNWQSSLGGRSQYLLQVQGAVYLARVEYDGQACILGGACSPYQSDTDYFGAVIEAVVARRSGRDAGTEWFAGGGIDNWRRDIAGDATVQGAVENWTVLYAVAGAGVYWRAPSARYHARLGAKYPVYTSEVPDLYDVTLAPKGRLSAIARVGVEFLADEQPRWGIGLYYDSYRFRESGRERSGSVLVWQPDSRQDVIGIFTTLYLH